MPIPDLNSLAAEIHEYNVAAGWWDEHLPDNKPDRFEDAAMLVITELAEATEGARKDLMDDKLPDEKMFDVELADAVIRLLDLAGALEIDLTCMDGALLAIQHTMRKKTTLLAKVLCAVRSCAYVNPEMAIRGGVCAVIALATGYDVDLWRLVAKKRAFNKTRKDHSREERAKKGGKKW